jgi:hypothetical protein
VRPSWWPPPSETTLFWKLKFLVSVILGCADMKKTTADNTYIGKGGS